MPFDTWLALVAATWVIFAIPGPTVLMVVSLVSLRGRRVALAAAAGTAAGDLTSSAVVLAGLGALILASATAFAALKWIGAAYLMWLGVRMLRGAGRHVAAAPAPEGGAGAVFRDVWLVTALNPKSIAFLVAFVPQFLDPARAPGPQVGITVATMTAIGFLNSGGYALLAASLGGLVRRPAARARLDRVGGATLIGMGAATALARRGV